MTIKLAIKRVLATGRQVAQERIVQEQVNRSGQAETAFFQGYSGTGTTVQTLNGRVVKGSVKIFNNSPLLNDQIDLRPTIGRDRVDSLILKREKREEVLAPHCLPCFCLTFSILSIQILTIPITRFRVLLVFLSLILTTKKILIVIGG